MKQKSISLLIMILVLGACNNSSHEHSSSEPTTKADSLMKEVLEGHDVAMAAQMTKMEKAKQGIQHLIDSVTKLPAKAGDAANAYKEKLYSVLSDLGYADNAMNKWMTDFKYDSAKNDMEQRIKYLADEKIKISHVKEAMLGSLQKADSLLK